MRCIGTNAPSERPEMIIVVDAHVLWLRPPAHWLDAYLLGRALLLER
jgi:hypothetical protein